MMPKYRVEFEVDNVKEKGCFFCPLWSDEFLQCGIDLCTDRDVMVATTGGKGNEQFYPIDGQCPLVEVTEND